MRHANDIGAMMGLWITTAAALPYTDDVCRTVVDTLLQMAGFDVLLLHIPTVAWDWLKKRPLLRPGCWGLVAGTRKDVVLKVLRFGDVELITSYLFVVWSEWSHLHRWSGGCPGMFRMIRELNGVGVAGHRADLIRRLEYVLSQLDPTSSEKQNYEEFRKALAEVDEEMTQILTSMSRTVVVLFSLLTYTQDATLPSRVHFLFHAHSVYGPPGYFLPPTGSFICEPSRGSLSPLGFVPLDDDYLEPVCCEQCTMYRFNLTLIQATF